jgi:hypothetical protein
VLSHLGTLTTPISENRGASLVNKNQTMDDTDVYEKESPTHKYLYMEFSRRAEFKADLGEEDRGKLIKEEERIEEVRRRFEADEEKGILMDELKESYKRWRDYAAKRPGMSIQNVLSENSSTLPPTTSDEASVPRNSSDTGTCPPSHGFKAGVMHFKKNGDCYKGIDFEHEEYYAGHFPHQKITVHEALKAEHNPFRTEPEHLKYFHFPANHMHWIEASRPT